MYNLCFQALHLVAKLAKKSIYLFLIIICVLHKAKDLNHLQCTISKVTNPVIDMFN